MGKKGTKRKTRWRTLLLGEDETGSGAEDEPQEEDRSTNSSVVGFRASGSGSVCCPAVGGLPLFRTGEKPFRPQRRFPYDRYRGKEPFIKLENKTFDEEEYTKIITPRQDVLFKKGYFGRKRESSAEESVTNAAETAGEEPTMDQYIITNGFLDERGHYYVNGSSYEVYDPYSNTVTVVMGPPPYASGVTQPVLAAVSCQPVPLAPVEWYPPGSDWPAQGSAWTPVYPHGEPVNGDAGPGSFPHDGRPGCVFRESFACATPAFACVDGRPPDGEAAGPRSGSPPNSPTPVRFDLSGTGGDRTAASADDASAATEEDGTDASCSERRKSRERDEEKGGGEANDCTLPGIEVAERMSRGKDGGENQECPGENGVPSEKGIPDEQTRMETEPYPAARQVEKQSHGTQTATTTTTWTRTEAETGAEKTREEAAAAAKMSHSTQTVPEEGSRGSAEERRTVPSPEKAGWRKAVSRRGGHAEDGRRARFPDADPIRERRRPDGGETATAPKATYARKLLNGLERATTAACGSARTANGECENGRPAETGPARRPESRPATPSNKAGAAGKRSLAYGSKFVAGQAKRMESRVANGSGKNGSEARSYGVRANARSWSGASEQATGKGREGRKEATASASERGGEEEAAPVLSEKSSTVSELSSPTELSSGQNTPPEKAIVRKMEQKIANDLNRSFEEKLKQNLTTGESEEGEDRKAEFEDGGKKEGTGEGGGKRPKKQRRRKEGEEKAAAAEADAEDGDDRGEDGEGEEMMEEGEREERGEEEGEHQQQGRKRGKGRERRSGGRAGGKATGAAEDGTGRQSGERQRGSRSKRRRRTGASGAASVATGAGDEPRGEANESEEEEGKEAGGRGCGGGGGGLFEVCGKSRDFLSGTWQRMNREVAGDQSLDLDSVLEAKSDDVLETLGIPDAWRLPNLALASDLLLFPGFGRERPKLTLEKLFACGAARELHGDSFTRRNITNLRSTRPEEFFATVVEAPIGAERKQTGRSARRGARPPRAVPDSGKKSPAEKAKPSVPPFEGGGGGGGPEREGKEEEERGGREEPATDRGERKLAIVEAVNSWLRNQENPEKVLAANALSDSLKELVREMRAADEEEGDRVRKNRAGNPARASSVDGVAGEEFGDDAARCGVANAVGVDRCSGAETAETRTRRKDEEATAAPPPAVASAESGTSEPVAGTRHRSSSWDAKLTETQVRKHFKFLTEAASWDGRRLRDVALRKHFRFIADSANYCHELIGEVSNGYELAREELCDPRRSVSKYYTLGPSPSAAPRSRRSNPRRGRVGEAGGGAARGAGQREEDGEEREDEGAAFDALEYRFSATTDPPGSGGGSLSVTDSGVHSDTESNEEASESAVAEPACNRGHDSGKNVKSSHLLNNEVGCKMQ